MLWYKGWLETRAKVVFASLYAFFPVPLMTLTQHTNAAGSYPSLAVMRGVIGFFGFYWAILPVLLAGSGVKTQTLRAQKGLHGSMYYTLSLPVSRLRLFLTRAGLGAAELAGILVIAPFAVLLIFPAMRPYVTHTDLLKYWLDISACCIGLYSIGVLLSTFLDDLTQNWTGMFGTVILFAVLSSRYVPPSFNVFRAMGADSPLFTHSMPWTTMGVAIAGAAILCLAAFIVVRAREY